MGRPRSCDCGICEKCKRADRARAAYRALTPAQRRAVVERRDKERERARDRERSRLPARRAHITRNTQRWRRENPEKYAAHVALNNAVRKGTVVRGPCEVCGSTRRVHGHHDDYSNPLEVRWLCPLHHVAER